jgi:hypothetical protein
VAFFAEKNKSCPYQPHVSFFSFFFLKTQSQFVAQVALSLLPFSCSALQGLGLGLGTTRPNIMCFMNVSEPKKKKLQECIQCTFLNTKFKSGQK